MGNSGADWRCNSYKVPGLSTPILESPHIAYLGDRYVLREHLGWGQFGVIRACSDLVSGEALACKSIAKNRLVSVEDVRSVKLEIEIMARLSGHPNVVDLKAVYEEVDFVHLVMELCAGGELFHRLEKHGPFLEREAAVIFRHLMEVVLFCHDNGVVHRDLKPENILLATKSLSSPIKLADFGLATYIQPGQSLCETVGSPFYIAPEVLAGSYNQAADVWSAGVILYILLSGMPPFWGKTKSRIFDAVRSLELRFPSDPWDGVSEPAKQLVSKMLCRDPLQRLTAKQVLEHSWIQEYAQQMQETNSHQTVLSFGQEDLGSCSFSSFSNPITRRSHDFSFGFSPVVNSGTGTSFSPSQADNTTGFTFPLLPSFSFFSPPPNPQENILNLSSNNAKGNTIQRDSSFGMLFDKEAKGLAATPRPVGLRSKRNHTIGLGEHEQLDLMVSESVIRWASCTHLPSAASLRSSLVC
ncbi:hypothetical protein M5K25_009702 [Dendrobium thyrsiflorum]|uniref:Protein kinase domain-containing protein n=1 Tax=Dendrobium thyrsiflorum TaxID=117978 RepID=A0ABD0V6H0_DENTH